MIAVCARAKRPNVYSMAPSLWRISRSMFLKLANCRRRVRRRQGESIEFCGFPLRQFGDQPVIGGDKTHAALERERQIMALMGRMFEFDSKLRHLELNPGQMLGLSAETSALARSPGNVGRRGADRRRD